MAVVVVTDSSSRLPVDELGNWGIRQVPLHILVDGHNLSDTVDDIPPNIHERPGVSTAGATPAELTDAYRRALADSGGDGVVAVHISGALSSTVTAAEQAAREFGSSVRVVDSRSAAMGTGFVALAAAREASRDSDLDCVAAEAAYAVERVRAFIVVHRLDNLRRSGRIGTAASWLSTALAIKPLLRVDHAGKLVLAQRVRTATKARAAMIEQAAEAVGDGTAAIAVHHVDNLDAASEIAAALAERLPGVKPTVTEMGPVLAIHVGAGAVGVCLHAMEPASTGQGEEGFPRR
jgi:DegV family protein with EDD domain